MVCTRWILVMVVVFCCVAASPRADLMLRSELVMSGLPEMEQAGMRPVDTVEVWMADSVMVSVASTGHVIMDHKTGEMTVILHEQGMYMTLPLPELTATVKPVMDSLQLALDSVRTELAEHPEKMDSILSAMGGDSASQDFARTLFESMAGDSNAALMTLTVTPSDETKKILGLTTHRYDVVMSVMGMEMTSTMWATEQIDLMNKFMYDWMQMSKGLLAGMGMGMDNMMEEMLKIKGSVVASSMSMAIAGMQMSVESNPLAIDTLSTCPPELLTVPAGYEQLQMPTPEMEAH